VTFEVAIGVGEINMPSHTTASAQNDALPTRESVLRYLVEIRVAPPEGPATEVLRVISELSPPDLRVECAAGRMSLGRRTLLRRLRAAGLPVPREWIGLARALRAHRVILRGGTLKDAALAGGYSDQFVMSQAIHRITGLRPSGMDTVGWTELVDRWASRQRARGSLCPRPSRSS
jgi:AraC-like DNA-binding protein